MDPATGQIVDANDGFGALFAMRPDAVVGRPLVDLVRPESASMLARQLEAAMRGELLHSFGRGRTPDGSDVVLEYVVHLVGGGIEGWFRPIPAASRNPR